MIEAHFSWMRQDALRCAPAGKLQHRTVQAGGDDWMVLAGEGEEGCVAGVQVLWVPELFGPNSTTKTSQVWKQTCSAQRTHFVTKA